MNYITRDNLKIVLKAISAVFTPMSTEELIIELFENDMLPVMADYDGSIFIDDNDVILW